MPYYRTTNAQVQRDSGLWTESLTGVVSGLTQGLSLAEGSVETGFRTRPPIGQATMVANSSADPHTLFQDQQDLKQRAAVKGGFDASMFRVDRGHPWDLLKYKYMGDPWNYRVFNSPSNYRVGSVVRPWVSNVGYAGANSGFDFHTSVQRTDLSSYGALTYGSASPLADRFSFSAFTGELREGLPKFYSEALRNRGKSIMDVGSDYLNIQFGWMPLLNDLRGIATALIRASHGLYQPAGATHRKRTEKPTELNLFGSQANSPVAIAAGNYSDPVALRGTGTGIITDHFIRADIQTHITAVRSRWFEGEFVYIPEAGFDATKYEDRLATLFKTDITPSDLWQLAPWSWLVDYFVDIGGALEATEVAMSNRTLSTYAYAMEKIEQTKSVVLTNIRGESGSKIYSGPSRHMSLWNSTSYRRIRANPFGFIPNPEVNLNEGQLGILGALGLTRLKR